MFPVEGGINHVDTAPYYGNSASGKNLGRALGRNRDGIIVSTKVGVTEADHATIASAINKGPLSKETLSDVKSIQTGFATERA